MPSFSHQQCWNTKMVAIRPECDAKKRKLLLPLCDITHYELTEWVYEFIHTCREAALTTWQSKVCKCHSQLPLKKSTEHSHFPQDTGGKITWSRLVLLSVAFQQHLVRRGSPLHCLFDITTHATSNKTKNYNLLWRIRAVLSYRTDKKAMCEKTPALWFQCLKILQKPRKHSLTCYAESH